MALPSRTWPDPCYAMGMKISHATAALLLTWFAACATPAPTGRAVHELEVEFRQLQSQQRVFREQNTVPQIFDFEGHGRVTVREITLDGYPGNTYLRCRFHYQNRTEEPIVQSWVMLDVLDDSDRLVSSQAVVCIIPHPMPIARGSYVSDELRTRTYGVHLEPGWKWRVRCVAQRQTNDPLDPPVSQNQWPILPPMIIKNRGQNDVTGSSAYDSRNGVRQVGGRGVRDTR